MQKRKATEPKERAKVRQWKKGKELRGGKVVVSTPSTIVDTMPMVSLCEHKTWLSERVGLLPRERGWVWTHAMVPRMEEKERTW